MLQLTTGRAFGERFVALIVVANACHADLVEQQLTDAGATLQGAGSRPDRSQYRTGHRACDHAWNVGIFLFLADAYLQALAQFDPGILTATQEAMHKARTEGSRIYPDAVAFGALLDDSIDYAVMERPTASRSCRS
jgi:mannose-1-phosphate guanylyltransferase